VAFDAPVAVLDIGANAGSWSNALMRDVQRMGHNPRRVALTMMDPQRSMHQPLHRLAVKWNATFLPYAAWTTDGGALNFYTSDNSEASSLIGAMARRYSTPTHEAKVQSVHTVDLARLLRFGLSGKSLALIKLDVEGAEYTLLPWLIRQGALCSTAALHLLVEWHLNSLRPEERLAGLGLRLSLEHILNASCGPDFAPRVVAHEEYFGNNHGEDVPGLQELQKARSSETRRFVPGAKVPWSAAFRLHANHSVRFRR